MDSQTDPNTTFEIGYATKIQDYMVWVNGLPNISINEVVVTNNNSQGFVTSIRNDLVEVLMLGDVKVKPKDEFRRTSKQLAIYSGSHLIGRAINPLGQPIDGKGPLSRTGQEIELEKRPPGINTRERINRQFETGVMLVDMLVPIAFGQRELLIGDTHSGKSGFLIDTIINQKGKNIICIYTAIGKPLNEIASLVRVLNSNKAFEYTVCVAASSSERAPLIYLAPIVGLSIAESFQSRGFDVLLILDDLGIHAKFYREISLLSGGAPGRQSYPGDIFHQHARLMERGGNFNKENNGGSITILPVIEASADDFASYMSTNLMGMTDGHLRFDSIKYHEGFRPSVDIAMSVSRVGRQTQNFSQKALADKVKLILAESERLEAFSRLGSEISDQTRMILNMSAQIREMLKQSPSSKIPIPIQMILLGLIFTPFLVQKNVNFVAGNKDILINFLQKRINLKTFLKQIEKMKSEKELIDSLAKIIPELAKVTSDSYAKP